MAGSGTTVGSSWGFLGVPWSHVGGQLGQHRATFEAILGFLGRSSWAVQHLGVLWAILGRSLGHLGLPGAIFGQSVAILDALAARGPPVQPQERTSHTAGTRVKNDPTLASDGYQGLHAEVRSSNLEDRGSRLSGLRGPSSSLPLDAARKTCTFGPREGSWDPF